MRPLIGAILLLAGLAAAADRPRPSYPSPPLFGMVADRAAAGCGTTKRGDVPIALRRLVPLISVNINGAPATMIFDTGAERTIVTTAAAERLGLKGHYEYGRPMRGLNGGLGGGDIDLRSLTAGGVALPAAHVLVASLSMPDLDGTVPDGLLGADVISAFDLDVDLAGRRLGFYERQNCADAAPTWAGTYATIIANRSLHDHLFFPVRLDGHPLTAFFDTGSQGNVLDAAAAASLGVTPAMLEADPTAVTHGVTPEAVPAHRHRFSRLDIGAEVARDPEFVVTRLGLVDGNMMLGVDYLLGMRLWLSYDGRRIFLARARP